MYSIIENIIGHSWSSNYSSDQQYIYYCCITLIIITFCILVDLVYRMVHSITHRGYN